LREREGDEEQTRRRENNKAHKQEEKALSTEYTIAITRFRAPLLLPCLYGIYLDRSLDRPCA